MICRFERVGYNNPERSKIVCGQFLKTQSGVVLNSFVNVYGYTYITDDKLLSKLEPMKISIGFTNRLEFYWETSEQKEFAHARSPFSYKMPMRMRELLLSMGIHLAIHYELRQF